MESVEFQSIFNYFSYKDIENTYPLALNASKKRTTMIILIASNYKIKIDKKRTIDKITKERILFY